MNPWTDERVKSLKRDWANGLSTSEIATRLGMGRGAICAKARRLDLPMRVPENSRCGYVRSKPRRNNPSKPKDKASFSSFNFARTPPRLARDAAEGSQSPSCPPSEGSPPPPLNIALEDFKHGQCRFPYGAGPFKFCGHPGSPYCEAHKRLCYQPAPNLNQQRRLKWQREQQEQAIADLVIPRS